MDANSGFGRRATMKGIGSLLTGGLVTAADAASTGSDGLASGTDGANAGFDGTFGVENGRVIVSGESASRPGARRYDATSTGLELDAETVASFLNYGVERRHLNVYEHGGEVLVQPGPSLEGDGAHSTAQSRTAELEVQPLCGFNRLAWVVQPAVVVVSFMMDHQLTEEVALSLVSGAALSEVAGQVVQATGAGSIPAAAFYVLGVALGYFAAVLTIKDEGCGVSIYFNYPFDPMLGPYGTIDPQGG